MVKINLINRNKSDIWYELTTFPDGEPHIKFTDDINRKTDYLVICRITNPNDLFVLMQVGDILNRQAVEFEVDIMYLMSMRMDRVITFNEAFSLDIVAQMINSIKPRLVRIFHCHSERAFKLIKNSVDFEESYGIPIAVKENGGQITKCYPDAGAAKRYNVSRDLIGIFLGDGRHIQLEKKRDLNDKGKIVSLEIVKEPKAIADSIVVEDDLCDAGGTFVWASKILKEKYPGKKIYIFVRHMVNPIGLKNLSENFDHVFITNSYKDWENLPENVTSIDVLDVYNN